MEDPPLSVLGSTLYLLNFVIPNEQLAGYVDLSEAALLLALTWVLQITWYHVNSGRQHAIVRFPSTDTFDAERWWQDPRMRDVAMHEYLGLLQVFAQSLSPARNELYQPGRS